MTIRRVLVTGLSGLIGGALHRELASQYAVRALNRRRVAGVECHLADLGDFEAIRPAFADVDAVVHLAAASGDDKTPADILSSNVTGTYHVFEAARLAGVSRVIFASSGATIAAYEKDPPWSHLVAGRYDQVADWPRLTHESPVRPSGVYAASKVWGEALARHYADAHGLSMICVRIGRVLTGDRPVSLRDFSVWCSQRDVVSMLMRCLAAPASVRFDVFFANSDNRWSYRDLDHPRKVLGWTPLDRAEDHRR